MVDLAEYEALRQRPPGRATMLQQWRDLTFLHISVEPDEIQKRLPKGLTVDTFEGKAWVGLVPFHMKGIRPLWGPAAPWLSAFPETNVRTYAHREGKEPGVWFFSLDAARWLACRYARLFFGLPYFHSLMTVDLGETIHYRSRRDGAQSEISARPYGDLRTAEPGSFDYFLLERYLLYAERAGQLYTGRVYHPPYPYRDVEILAASQSILESHGFTPGVWEHQAFSPGVDVEVFSIETVR